MIFFRRDPGAQVDKAIVIITDECAADEREGLGLRNRPRYLAAKQAILKLGRDATSHVLRHLKQLEDAELGSNERYVADDLIELLGNLRDPDAVPKLSSLMGGFSATLSFALAKTDEGTRALLEATRSPDEHIRATAMGVWSSDFRPTEVIAALESGLVDSSAYVRHEAISSAIARGRADDRIISALRRIRSSDPDERLRERADSALRRLIAA